MKKSTLYIATFLCLVFQMLGQEAPTLVSVDACQSTYTGQIEVDFEHDMATYPLSYIGSYCNTTTGDYGEFAIGGNALDSINSLLKKLDGLGCGPVYFANKNIGATLQGNSSLFYCFRNTPTLLDTFRVVMNEITPLLDYNSEKYYIQFFDQIKLFNDPKSFEISINLLKYDYTPDPEFLGDPVIAPVNYYVYWKLILPHIKSVNNLPLEKSELFVPHEKFSFMNTKEFYEYMKELWESGALKLNED